MIQNGTGGRTPVLSIHVVSYLYQCLRADEEQMEIIQRLYISYLLENATRPCHEFVNASAPMTEASTRAHPAPALS